jgi:hypothetical protein
VSALIEVKIRARGFDQERANEIAEHAAGAMGLEVPEDAHRAVWPPRAVHRWLSSWLPDPVWSFRWYS